MTRRGFHSNQIYCYKAIVKDVVNRSTVILDVDLGFKIHKPNQRYRVLKINKHAYKSSAINSKHKVLRYIRPGDKVIIKSEQINGKHFCEISTEEHDPHLYQYNAYMVKIVDGDTVDVNLDLGFSTNYIERFRLYGIDAWETRGEEKTKGLLAKARVMELAPIGTNIIMRTFKDVKGKYGRYLGEINLLDNDKNVNEILVEEGHAEVY